MADKHVTGPIQVFVIGFDKFEATGRIMAELRRARKRGSFASSTSSSSRRTATVTRRTRCT